MELRPRPYYYTNLCYDINFVEIVPTLYIINNHYGSAYNGKCVRSPKLLTCVVWNVIMFLTNILNNFVPCKHKMCTLIHLSFAHFGLCPIPDAVKTPEDLEQYKRAIKIIGSMTEYCESKLNEAELIAYPFISNLGNATVFAFSYLYTLNSRIMYLKKNDNFNLDKHALETIKELLDRLDKKGHDEIHWIYAKLESHVVFPYFATFWLEAHYIVGKNDLYRMYLTTNPTPIEYKTENFTIVLKRPCENSVHLLPTDNVSYQAKHSYNFLSIY